MTQLDTRAAAEPGISGSELAMAFEGKLERTPVSIGYHLGVLLVAGVMVLLPVVYVAIIAAAAWLVTWHATHSVAMFSYVRGRALFFAGVIYVAPLVAGAVLVLFMILPMFWRSKKGPRPLWVARREQPLLYAYVDRLCDAMRVPRPARIDVIASANASAHIDNGFLGIIHRRLVLTIGLPLVNAMTLRQFTGVLAHEFGHFAQGTSMRLSYVVGSINGWFARMAWGRNGIDDALDEQLADGPHWSIALIAGLCKLSLGIVRLILKAMATISHFLSMHLSRQAEFDADKRSARIVGSVAMEDALQLLPFIDTAHAAALEQAQGGWLRQRLPDDLVVLADFAYLHMPEEIKERINSSILTADAGWFDTHPPLFKRVAALKKARLQGVLKLQAPATVLFREFDELCKLATIDFYQTVLGTQLRPEHLHPTLPPTSERQIKPRPAPGTKAASRRVAGADAAR